MEHLLAHLGNGEVQPDRLCGCRVRVPSVDMNVSLSTSGVSTTPRSGSRAVPTTASMKTPGPAHGTAIRSPAQHTQGLGETSLVRPRLRVGCPGHQALPEPPSVREDTFAIS